MFMEFCFESTRFLHWGFLITIGILSTTFCYSPMSLPLHFSSEVLYYLLNWEQEKQ